MPPKPWSAPIWRPGPTRPAPDGSASRPSAGLACDALMWRQRLSVASTARWSRRRSGGKGGRQTVALDASESPLVWLSRRRDRGVEPLIDPAAYEAGERLRRDLTLAAILPRVTVGWDRAAGPSGGPPRDPAGGTD